MSKAAHSIRKGLEEAVAYAKGRASKEAYRVHVPDHVDVKAIRTKLRMTQQASTTQIENTRSNQTEWNPFARSLNTAQTPSSLSAQQPRDPPRAVLVEGERTAPAAPAPR
jgi:hypothetical protein